MTERLCECGCGRSLAERSDKARFYEDRCRAKMYHERQRAGKENPGPKAHNPGPEKRREPGADKRTEKRGRPIPREEQQTGRVRPHNAADRQSEGERGPYVVGAPEVLNSHTWEQIKRETAERRGLKREVKDSEVKDQDVTDYHNNMISHALCESQSACGRCGRRGGGDPAKGGAGPLKTKMGKPKAYCGDCWPKVFPGEAF